MNGNAWPVRRRVQQAWSNAIHGLKQMNSSSMVRPREVSEIFKVDDNAPEGVVKLIVGPVVFQVPERPNRTPNLFIVVSGELSFERPNPKSAPLRTKDFATRVAYFRSKPGRLEHVYGAHYDMDEQVRRHPVFHAQFRPYEQFAQCIQTLFHRDDEIDGYLCNVLRNVRIPTAQMDVFSVLTQICADHLIDEQSTSEVTDAFQRMRIACNFFEGAARRVAFLGTESAVHCYRLTHWYGVGGVDI